MANEVNPLYLLELQIKLVDANLSAAKSLDQLVELLSENSNKSKKDNTGEKIFDDLLASVSSIEDLINQSIENNSNQTPVFDIDKLLNGTDKIFDKNISKLSTSIDSIFSKNVYDDTNTSIDITSEVPIEDTFDTTIDNEDTDSIGDITTSLKKLIDGLSNTQDIVNNTTTNNLTNKDNTVDVIRETNPSIESSIDVNPSVNLDTKIQDDIHKYIEDLSIDQDISKNIKIASNIEEDKVDLSKFAENSSIDSSLNVNTNVHNTYDDSNIKEYTPKDKVLESNVLVNTNVEDKLNDYKKLDIESLVGKEDYKKDIGIGVSLDEKESNYSKLNIDDYLKGEDYSVSNTIQRENNVVDTTTSDELDTENLTKELKLQRDVVVENVFNNSSDKGSLDTPVLDNKSLKRDINVDTNINDNKVGSLSDINVDDLSLNRSINIKNGIIEDKPVFEDKNYSLDDTTLEKKYNVDNVVNQEIPIFNTNNFKNPEEVNLQRAVNIDTNIDDTIPDINVDSKKFDIPSLDKSVDINREFILNDKVDDTKGIDVDALYKSKEYNIDNTIKNNYTLDTSDTNIDKQIDDTLPRVESKNIDSDINYLINIKPIINSDSIEDTMSSIEVPKNMDHTIDSTLHVNSKVEGIEDKKYSPTYDIIPTYNVDNSTLDTNLLDPTGINTNYSKTIPYAINVDSVIKNDPVNIQDAPIALNDSNVSRNINVDNIVSGSNEVNIPDAMINDNNLTHSIERDINVDNIIKDKSLDYTFDSSDISKEEKVHKNIDVQVHPNIGDYSLDLPNIDDSILNKSINYTNQVDPLNVDTPSDMMMKVNVDRKQVDDILNDNNSIDKIINIQVKGDIPVFDKKDSHSIDVDFVPHTDMVDDIMLKSKKLTVEPEINQEYYTSKESDQGTSSYVQLDSTYDNTKYEQPEVSNISTNHKNDKDTEKYLSMITTLVKNQKDSNDMLMKKLTDIFTSQNSDNTNRLTTPTNVQNRQLQSIEVYPPQNNDLAQIANAIQVMGSEIGTLRDVMIMLLNGFEGGEFKIKSGYM